MASAFKGILKEYTLTYEKVGAASVSLDPVTGEALLSKTSETMTVSFAPSKNDALIFSDGADVKNVDGIVTCLDPVRFPDNLNNGSEFDMAFNGVEGKLTLKQIIVDDLAAIETALGQVAKATWRQLN